MECIKKDLLDTNIINLEGVVSSGLEFSHNLLGEVFYTFNLEVGRLSAIKDILPVTVSERLLIDIDINVGTQLAVSGQLRSYNKFLEVSNKLILTVFARDISYCDRNDSLINEVELHGFVCKQPIYRTTPFGREIADVLIAVNRSYNKSDYIPLVAWGKNARYAQLVEVGDEIKITGRLQSREYSKKLSDSESVTRIAYEVSVSRFEKIDNNNSAKEDCALAE